MKRVGNACTAHCCLVALSPSPSLPLFLDMSCSHSVLHHISPPVIEIVRKQLGGELNPPVVEWLDKGLIGVSLPVR
eukprot:6935716-Pyramimonas_sp.AAC.2